MLTAKTDSLHMTLPPPQSLASGVAQSKYGLNLSHCGHGDPQQSKLKRESILPFPLPHPTFSPLCHTLESLQRTEVFLPSPLQPTQGQ